MKRTLITLIGLALIIGILGGVAAANTDDDVVDFTVTPTMELLASSVNLGDVSPGSNGPTDETPVTVNSNINWDVTAFGPDFANAGATVSLGIENLTMGGNALNGDNVTEVVIASGVAGFLQVPTVATSLNVPWTGDLGAETLDSTLTYTAVPQ